MTPAPQKEYIITDNMLMIWRDGCIRANFRVNDYDDKCLGCEFDNQSRGGCDFDDDEMQKIFQSTPILTTSAEQVLCSWRLDDEYCTYETSCGASFQFTDGELEDNGGFKFCPYCGKKITELRQQQAERERG